MLSQATAWPSWTVQYKLKRTGASTSQCTGNLHIHNTNWKKSEPYFSGKKIPTRAEGNAEESKRIKESLTGYIQKY